MEKNIVRPLPPVVVAALARGVIDFGGLAIVMLAAAGFITGNNSVVILAVATAGLAYLAQMLMTVAEIEATANEGTDGTAIRSPFGFLCVLAGLACWVAVLVVWLGALLSLVM